MNRRFRILALAVLALALPASSEAAPTWLLPALPLSAAGANADGPAVAVDQAGNAAAIWTRASGPDYFIQSSFRAAGGAWGTPQNLSAASELPMLWPAIAGEAQIAFDGAGNAFAVWARKNVGAYVVQAAIRPAATGVWGAPQDLSYAGNDARIPQLAVNAVGDAVVTWRSDGASKVIDASFRPAGGAWGALQHVSVSGHDANLPRVGIDSAGNAVAVWPYYNGTANVVQASTRSRATGLWEASPQTISAANASSPDVTVAPAGDALAIWYNGTRGESSFRPAATGVWGAGQQLAPAPDYTSNPRVALDAAGNAVADWEIDTTGRFVDASFRPAATGVWSTPQHLSASGASAYGPQVGFDAAGNAVAVWYRYNTTKSVVQSSRRAAANGVWSQPENLSADGQDALSLRLAVDPAGNAVAVWKRSNGTNVIVESAGLDAAGPVFNALTVPATGVALSLLSLSVSPLDVWSGLGGLPHWSFGDGGSADGTSVEHTYKTAGHFTVTLTQSDAVGNQSSASRSITVAPPLCVVPKVRGKRLSKARAAIKRNHCRTGKVTRAFSKKVKQGSVLSQRPKAGKRLANGAKVNLVVSRGKRPQRR